MLIDHTHASGFNSHQRGGMIDWYNMKVKAQVWYGLTELAQCVSGVVFFCGAVLTGVQPSAWDHLL